MVDFNYLSLNWFELIFRISNEPSTVWWEIWVLSFFTAGFWFHVPKHFGNALRITVFGDIPSYFLKNASAEYEDPGVECPSADIDFFAST